MSLTDILMSPLAMLDYPASILRSAMAGRAPTANPFSFEGRAFGEDVVDNLGLPGGKASGLLIDLLADPLHLGTIGAIRNAGKIKAARQHNKSVQSLLDAGAMPAEVARETKARAWGPEHVQATSSRDLRDALTTGYGGSHMPPAKLYHGTSAPLFDSINIDKTSPSNLFGQGYYQTTSPRLASSYAKYDPTDALTNKTADPLAMGKLDNWVSTHGDLNSPAIKHIADGGDFSPVWLQAALEDVRKGFGYEDINGLYDILDHLPTRPGNILLRSPLGRSSVDDFRSMTQGEIRETLLDYMNKSVPESTWISHESQADRMAEKIKQVVGYDRKGVEELEGILAAYETAFKAPPARVNLHRLDTRAPLDMDATVSRKKFNEIAQAVGLDERRVVSDWRKRRYRSHYPVPRLDDIDSAPTVVKPEKWWPRSAYDVARIEDGYKGQVTGASLWNFLSGQMETPAVTDAIKSAGHDSLTHIGGVRAGGGKRLHRVFIGLDPDKIYKGHTIAPDPVTEPSWLRSIMMSFPTLMAPARVAASEANQ